MQKPQPLRPEQLKAGYKAPHRTDGTRQEVDGVLTTRASFTTSQRAHEALSQARPDNGPSRTGFASSVEGTTPPSNVRPAAIRYHVQGCCEPLPADHKFDPVTRKPVPAPLPKTDHQRKMTIPKK